MAQESRTPNRDKWFERNAKRGLKVEKSDSDNGQSDHVESTPETSNVDTPSLDAAPAEGSRYNTTPPAGTRTPAGTTTPTTGTTRT